MTTENSMRSRGRQHGFTLVEMGVVLVLMGLLMGAVLKGQELIKSAQVFQLAQAINGYRAAINGFQDRYQMMPGDSSEATIRLGANAVNCTISCNDGYINYWPNVSLVNNHLSVSGFYGGPFLSSEIDAAPTVNGYLKNPGNAPIFAAFWANFSANPGGSWGSTYSHTVSTGWNLTSKMLGEFDRKLDDGNAWTGSVRRGFGGDSRCADLTTGVWPDNAPSVNCAAVMLF